MMLKTLGYFIGEFTMPHLIRCFCMVLIWAFFVCVIPAPAGEVPKGIVFDFSLPIPELLKDRAYLGLDGGTPSFVPGQVKTRILLIQIFSMYCPICQREAAVTNQLFGRIKSDKNLNRQIKMIGIGAGNSEFEVDFFKSNYGIEFPLFSDPRFIIHKKVNEVGTPHFFGLKLSGDSPELIFSHSGALNDIDLFLSRLKKATAIEDSHD